MVKRSVITPVSMYGCPGWSKSSLEANLYELYEMSRLGSIITLPDNWYTDGLILINKELRMP